VIYVKCGVCGHEDDSTKYKPEGDILVCLGCRLVEGSKKPRAELERLNRKRAHYVEKGHSTRSIDEQRSRVMARIGDVIVKETCQTPAEMQEAFQKLTTFA
jgi:hypothetical protein